MKIIKSWFGSTALYAIGIAALYLIILPPFHMFSVITWTFVTFTVYMYGVLQTILSKEDEYRQGFAYALRLIGTVLFVGSMLVTITNTETSPAELASKVMQPNDIVQAVTNEQVAESEIESNISQWGAKRIARFKYPIAPLEDIHIQNDESGHPYYVLVSRAVELSFDEHPHEGIYIVDGMTGEVSYYPVRDVPDWIVLPEYHNRIESVLNTPADEAYALASKGIEENKTWPEFDYLSQDELDTLHESLDYELMNELFGEIINAFRAEHGLNPVVHYPEYDIGTSVIAKELADYGFISPVGQQPHTRPYPNEGEMTLSVFDSFPELKKTALGENLIFLSMLSNPYYLTSEQFLAEHFFEGWLSSPSHRALMISDTYEGFHMAVAPALGTNVMLATSVEGGPYVDYRISPNPERYGIIGVLTMVRE